MNNPKFEQKIKERLIQPGKDQQYTPNYGIIVGYNNITNRATVMTAQNGSEDLGQIFHDVPCPVIKGVQTVAPRVGYPCWIQFKDNNLQFPVISHFFNHVYHSTDLVPQNRAFHYTPRFQLSM